MNVLQSRAFCDTSFFSASLYPGDTDYDRAGDILAECQEQSVTLHTSWDIVSKTQAPTQEEAQQLAENLWENVALCPAEHSFKCFKTFTSGRENYSYIEKKRE
ncbi:MAG: hypothetical protein HGA22_13750 [Clostridiales bacterium]|nr:hypothetical protein [Clostridiales bacterium]